MIKRHILYLYWIVGITVSKRQENISLNMISKLPPTYSDK